MSGFEVALGAERLVDNGISAYEMLFAKVRSEYGEAIFNNWFSQVRFRSLSDRVMVLATPSKFVREWIIANYFTKLCKMLDSNLVQSIDLVCEDEAHSAGGRTEHSALPSADNFISSASNSKLTFKNFISAFSNRVAYTAAQGMANFHCNDFGNALFIHGGVGMGKTHLLQAILAFANEHHPKKRVGYLSAEKFMHRYMMAVRSNELVSFKEKLRSLDMLLFDDLQFICDKVSTQKEFSNTINALLEENKRVVVVADRSPYDMDLDVRTKSRLVGGVTAEIQRADFELRIAILREKAALMHAEVSEEILVFLAESVTSSIRELEGALNKLMTHCMLNELPMTLRSCKEILRDCLKAHEQSISVAKIVQAIADANGVTQAVILSKSRIAKLVYLRQMAAYLAKELTPHSLQEIGKHLGGKDHATIIYSIRQFEGKMASDSEVVDSVRDVKQLLMLNE